jgi:hypothetical protein
MSRAYYLFEMGYFLGIFRQKSGIFRGFFYEFGLATWQVHVHIECRDGLVTTKSRCFLFAVEQPMKNRDCN